MKKLKKSKKVLLIVSLSIILSALFSVLCNAAVVSKGGEYIDRGVDKKFDCILILGAKVYDDGTPCPMLADRLDRGIELYFAGVSGKILVSGDHGTDGYDEVNAMKAYCIDRGVPSEDIFMDHAGFSTYDSMVRAKEVFLCESVMIVTQRYHLYRAVYIARLIGLDAYGASASLREYAGSKCREAREFLARIKDTGYVFLRVRPKYAGEPVPITGSGDVTNDI